MKYVILDLEMCRVFDDFEDVDLASEIIQIGAVLLNKKYEIVDDFMTFVCPKWGQIDNFIHNLTGISNDDIKDAPDLENALELFLTWLPEKSILVSWSDTDKVQLQVETSFKELQFNELEQYYETWEDCQLMFSEKMNTEKVYKLSEALRISDIFMDDREHDAQVDARNTALLFKKMKTEKKLKLNHYYMSQDDVKRSVYNPFMELLKNYKVEN